MKKISIALGADHAGYPIKRVVAEYLIERGYTILDMGTNSTDSIDYPDYAHPVAAAVEKGECPLGFVFCGSGNGVNITANKHKGVRSALCWTPEIAALARQHNDANICAIPARFVSAQLAVEIASSFLAASFEGGRHAARVAKIE